MDEASSNQPVRGTYPFRAASMELDPNDPLVIKLRMPSGGKKDLIARAASSEQVEEWAWIMFQCCHAANLN